VRIEEPGGDLPIALAIASAARGVPVLEGAAAFGEIGLTGRLRPAAQADRRLDECGKLGISTVVVPEGTPVRDRPRIAAAATLRAALRAGLEASAPEREAAAA
jgi:DNA repair protein RadA/Sms